MSNNSTTGNRNFRPETYYRDHWVDIEPERLAAYESMFEWRPQMAPLLEPADLNAGQTVVDYGCGPGALAIELAGRVGAAGRVLGYDLNEDMIRLAKGRAENEALGANTEFTVLTDDKLPLPDHAVDRVVCKNVLEYVTDVVAVLKEFRRVIKPGGRAHVIDSDWGLLTVEPLGPARLRALFDAASPAYNTPHIGRLLYGFMREAGFEEIQIKVLCPADTHGYLSQVVFNMLKYAQNAGALDKGTLDGIAAELNAAIENRTYL